MVLLPSLAFAVYLLIGYFVSAIWYRLSSLTLFSAVFVALFYPIALIIIFIYACFSKPCKFLIFLWKKIAKYDEVEE